MSLDNGSSAVGMPELVVIRAAFVLEAVVLEKSDDLSSLSFSCTAIFVPILYIPYRFPGIY